MAAQLLPAGTLIIQVDEVLSNTLTAVGGPGSGQLPELLEQANSWYICPTPADHIDMQPDTRVTSQSASHHSVGKIDQSHSQAGKLLPCVIDTRVHACIPSQVAVCLSPCPFACSLVAREVTSAS